MNRNLMMIAAALSAAVVVAPTGQEAQGSKDSQVFRFKTGVELINVTATVTDANGRFVSGLRKEDFQLFEDGQEQTITHFNSERVPVSLGLVVDTSGSMEGDKWVSARQALNRFRFQLLDRDDEVFCTHSTTSQSWSRAGPRTASGLRRVWRGFGLAERRRSTTRSRPRFRSRKPAVIGKRRSS